MFLHKLNDLVCVKIISRPSKICKTPYVADIELPMVKLFKHILLLWDVVDYVKKILMC